jgi:hypothetical protein
MAERLCCSARTTKVLYSNLGAIKYRMTLDKSLTAVCLGLRRTYTGPSKLSPGGSRKAGYASPCIEINWRITLLMSTSFAVNLNHMVGRYKSRGSLFHENIDNGDELISFSC